jgi:hypothetical protein
MECYVKVLQCKLTENMSHQLVKVSSKSTGLIYKEARKGRLDTAIIAKTKD